MTDSNAPVAVITGASSGIGAATAAALAGHITHPQTRQAVEQTYSTAEVTAEDVAEVIAFAIARPRHLASARSCSAPPGRPDRKPPGEGTANSQPVPEGTNDGIPAAGPA